MKNKTIFSPQIETFVSFAASDDPSRLNMTNKQITQTTVSKNTEIPFLLDKEYQKFTDIPSPFLEIAEDDGFVIYKDEKLLIYYYKNQKKLVTKYLHPVKKLVNYSISLKYVIDKPVFKKGDILIDYTNIDTETKLPKIGYRAKIAYMPFFGYSADDAIVISESFAKKATIEYSEKIYIPITKLWKYYLIQRNEKEEIDTYLPLLGEQQDDTLIKFDYINSDKHFISELHNTSQKPSIFFTKKIEGIKDGKIVNIKVHVFNKELNKAIDTLDPLQIDKAIDELDQKYIYNRFLIKELKPYIFEQLKEKIKIKETLKKYIKNENDLEKITNQIFNQYIMMQQYSKHYQQFLLEEFGLDYKEVDALVEIDIIKEMDTTRGDKFTNIHAGKATVALIIPDELMPVDENGNKIDALFNTLGIPGRNNWGMIYESITAKIIENVEKTAKKAHEYRVNNSDETNEDYQKLIDLLKEKIEFINENFIKIYDEEYYQQVKELLSNYYEVDEHEIPLYEKLIQDIAKKGFYLFVPNFLPNMNYNVFLNNFAIPYSEKFGVNLGKDKIVLKKELLEWLRNKYGFKAPMEYIKDHEVESFVGFNYMIKLHHTSFSKYNAVNFAAGYSKITGQPIRGRKKQGGQHVSWQSLAALLAHGERNPVLKELYTIKADSIDEKYQFILKYIRDGEYLLKHRYNSVTKKTLRNALKVFCMDFEDEED